MTHPELLTTAAEIAPLVESSRSRPVLIFKHSLTCPISSAAYGEYQRLLGAAAATRVEHRLIEVQNARGASNAVAEATGVRHETPQALLLAGGQVIWHRSHWQITEKALAEALAAL